MIKQKKKKKKNLKEYAKGDAAGQHIWEHDGSSISRGSSHENWVVF